MFISLEKIACALAVLATTSTAVMASNTATVTVSGNIVPGPCNLHLNSQNVDYGDIDYKSLPSKKIKKMDRKYLFINVNCTANTYVAIRVTNNSPGSAAKVIRKDKISMGGIISKKLFHGQTNYVFGLGVTSAGKKIGGYTMTLSRVSINGVSARTYIARKLNNKALWVRESINHSALTRAQYLFSWSTSDSTAPSPIKIMTGILCIDAYINSPEDMYITKEENIKGSATIELVYI